MSAKIVIEQKQRLLDDVFAVDAYAIAHLQNDGTTSARQRRLVFERGDSAAALLFNRDNNSVVLVEQFKLPALIGRRRDEADTEDGRIVETPAGIVESNETPEQAAIRETAEETGYRIRQPKLVARFFSSPGATSERVFLFYAEVRDSDRTGPGGGIGDEDIEVLHVALGELFARLADGTIDDPKLIIAAYWLQNHLRYRDSTRL